MFTGTRQSCDVCILPAFPLLYFSLPLLIQIYATSAGKDVLDAQRGRKCWPFLTSVFLILLFASRGIYSVVAVVTGSSHHYHYGYSWTFATDEVSNHRIIGKQASKQVNNNLIGEASETLLVTRYVYTYIYIYI